MRREMRRNAKDQETEIAMRKNESSSVVESYGDLHAVTNLEDDARRPERGAGSWRSENSAPNTRGGGGSDCWFEGMGHHLPST